MIQTSSYIKSFWILWRRHTPLTLKALLVSVVLGLLFWLAMDFWQTRQVQSIFRSYLLGQLEEYAQRDRTHLDGYFRAQTQAAKLLPHQDIFVRYFETVEKSWLNNPEGSVLNWPSNQQPPWLPPRSVVRSLAYAPYTLLLDSDYSVREQFQNAGLPPLPDKLLKDNLADLVGADGTNTIFKYQDIVYLITSSALADADGIPTVFLVFIAPLDDNFLTLFHFKAKNYGTMVFIDTNNNQIFASSRPDTISSGSLLSSLQDRYILVGKKFLDYGFSTNFLFQVATLIPIEEIEHVSKAILSAEKRQRAFGYITLALLFLGIVYWVAKSLQRFTQKMVDISIDQLGIQPKTAVKGDQLLMMEEQFKLMTDKILHARESEKEYREELETINEALNKSLVLNKRTQTQLVESEKMASLGGLVAGVAHEINTPVGIGVTAASFLEQKSQLCATHLSEGTLQQPELEAYIRNAVESSTMILNNLHRAADLIKSFKQVAVDRTNEGRRVFGLKNYVNQVLTSLHPQFRQNLHTVHVECSDTLEINSTPGVFSQIITNFVMNSLTHGFKKGCKGTLTFKLSKEDGNMLLFHYSDDGQGMEKTVCDRVFEPFFTTTRGQGGSGLGMHIVFNLVTQTLRGNIRCSSSPGHGTTYTLQIPMNNS